MVGIGVTCSDQPGQHTVGMTEADAGHVTTHLLDEMDKIAPGKLSQPIQFKGSQLASGVWMTTCGNQATLEWLKQATQGLPPRKEGEKVVHYEFLGPEKFSLTRVFVWVPARFGTVPSTDLILARLQRQNPDLATTKWAVYTRTDKPDGSHIVLGVDKGSLAVLERVQMRPYCEFTQLHFTKPGGAQK
jgi:hypothetical protein